MIHLRKKHRYLFSVLSGILMTISFPFTGSLTLVAFVAWIPLLLVESSISRNNYRSRKVFTHAFLAFLIYNVGTTWWVWNADEFGAILAFTVNSLLMSTAFYMFHLTKKYVGSKEGYISLVIYWVAFEHFHLDWDASWPWLMLGNTFSITPAWIQWYSYTGVTGGTIWILIMNLLIFRAFDNVLLRAESWRIQTPFFILSSAVFLVPLGISIVTYLSYEELKNPIEIVVVQNNLDPYNEKFTSNVYDKYDDILTLAEKEVTKSTDLIVAPETSITASLNEETVFRSQFYRFIVNRKNHASPAPLHIGSFTYKDFDMKNSIAARKKTGMPGYFEHYNSSLLIDSLGGLDIIHKSKLVPGVESVPFSTTFPWMESIALDLGGISGSLGIESEPMVFESSKFNFAPVICYESVYGEFVAIQCRKGAQFISIITNDGWWGDTPGYKQHQSFASLRAIENRRSIARSANTGSSCFVNQRGDIIQATNWWEEAVIKDEINLNSEITIYSSFGDYLGRSFSFVAVLLLLFTFVKRFMRYVKK